MSDGEFDAVDVTLDLLDSMLTLLALPIFWVSSTIQGKYDDTELYFERSLKISERILGLDSPNMSGEV